MDKDWKHIKGFKNLYSISMNGEVWSVRRKQYLRGTKNQKYLRVSLSRNGIVKNYSIHALVARAFIGKRPQGKVINHKDINKHNNCVPNLEYVTNKENVAHAVNNGVHPKGTRHGRAKLTEANVCLIRSLYKTGKYQKFQLAKKFNISPRTIREIVQREIWKHI